MTRIAIDTNILVYLQGVARVQSDVDKIRTCAALIGRLSEQCSLVAPAQTLGELFAVLKRSGMTSEEARDRVSLVAETFAAPVTETTTIRDATDLAVDHNFQIWDAVILTAAADAGCSILLSEDMHHGFVAKGLTIINPFVTPAHPKLKRLIA